MLRKIFSAFILAVMMVAVNSQAFAAASVSVVLDTPSGYFSEPEKVYKTVQASIDKMFANVSQFDIKPVSECDAQVQIYREENGLAASYDQSLVGANDSRDLTFKKEDIAKMCNKFNDSYLLYVRVSTTAPRATGGMLSSGQKVNVVLDFRVWSRAKNDFVYTKRTTTTGSSNTFYFAGSGSLEHAVEKGLKKGLAEIEKDSTKIKSSMIG